MADAPTGPATKLLNAVNKAQEIADMPNLLLAKATEGILQFLPKMPAARLFGDLVFQYGHSHPHPPSFGVPIPSVGPILCAGAVNVLINGLPAARNGDLGLAVWCGGYFPVFEVLFGSSHVFIGGSRAARMLMDPTLHCLPDLFSKGGGAATKAVAKAAVKEAAKAAAKTLVQGALMTGGMKLLQAAAEAEKPQKTEEEVESEDQAAADAAAAAADAAASGLEAAMTALQLAADAAAAAMSALLGKDPGVGFPMGFITMGSPNVLIGGFPMPGWSTILKGLGKLLKALIRKIQLKLPKGKLRQALCFITGHPVDVSSGRMFRTNTDFGIDGHIPVKFDRVYDTSATDYESSLGWGWTHPYDQHLWQSKRHNCLILRNEENRQVRFDKLAVGQKQFQPLERLWLERKSETEYEIFNCYTGLFYKFSQTVEGDFHTEKTALRLTEIFDRSGSRVELKHDGGQLTEITNGSGSFLTLHYHDTAGKPRLAEIRQHLRNGQNISLMKYGYNGDAELISATNRTYAAETYLYENHLMTRETNRNNLSFHFEYDADNADAKCVHTWGDGNIYERWISYSPKARITKVKDGLGGETIYHYDELDLVTKVYNAEGGVYQREYGDFGELLKETDEEGNTREYGYDEQLNRVEFKHEDGTTKQISFNEMCLPVEITDEAGAQWKHEYDERGNVVALVNPLEARREYVYDRDGDIVEWRDALGNTTKFEWTIAGQIKTVTRPRGGRTLYDYNERDLLSEIFDEMTQIRSTYQYDDQGRITRFSRINARRETLAVQRYEYDDQDNLTGYINALGSKTTYRFGGYDKMTERVDALGFNRKYEYDAEERLTKITNERGENYQFKYDRIHRLVKEKGFDGAVKTFGYDQTSRLTYQKDALQRETYYERDKVGRVIRCLRSDASTVNYEYDVCGRIIKAKNPESEVTLAYDANSNLVGETQNGQTISYEYDLESRKIARRFNAANFTSNPVEYDYDADDNLTLIKIGGREINCERDDAGRLVSRQMPNGLREKFDYDANGFLSAQRVSVGANGRELVRREYEWDAPGNIIRVNDSLRGERRYGYDAVERLSKIERIVAGEDLNLPETNAKKSALPADKLLWQADNQGFDANRAKETEELIYDGDGNLVERRSNVRGSRNFRNGAGDRLERLETVQYIYNAVGNLIQKRAADGTLTGYEYNADDRLAAVSGENGKRVEFQYDAFGRRISKKSGAGETSFVWDGDVLLSEKKDSQTAVEYVYEEFVPLVKVVGSEIESFHTDYLGTPKEVTDAGGNLVWQGNYDEYGRVREAVAQTEQNIRFQGQYEDRETGLFYNRYRYYDADGGRFITPDPISLAGGDNLYLYSNRPTVSTDPLGLTGVADPDYPALRKGSPSDAIREHVNRGSGQKVDPVYRYNVDSFEADHIIPLKRITEYPGFSTLSYENKLKVANLEGNFIGLGKSSNASKGAKLFTEWEGHKGLGPIHPATQKKLAKIESDAEKAVKAEIKRLNKEQAGGC